MGGVILIGGLAALVLWIVANWMIFQKAGQAGWKSIIPIYSTVVQLRIVGQSGWLALLLLLPWLGSLIILIIVGIGLAKSFGRGGGFAVGLILLSVVFYCILAFGSSTYIGPKGEGPAGAPGEEVAAW
jgi:hypothetical protein